MVNQMVQKLGPEYVPHGQLLAVEVGDGLIELLAPQVREACRGLLVDPAKPGSQEIDFPWAFEVRGFVFETESMLSDPEAQAGVNFAEMPRQLSDGTAFGVGSEVVLVARECFENADCALRLCVPGGSESVNLVAVGHRYLQGCYRRFSFAVRQFGSLAPVRPGTGTGRRFPCWSNCESA